MNTPTPDPSNYLHDVDAGTMSYEQARSAMHQAGYTDAQVNQAVLAHIPRTPAPTPTTVPDEATIATAKAKLAFVTERALREDQVQAIAMGAIVPSKTARGYFLSAFLAKRAGLKNLEETGTIDGTSEGRLYQRSRLVRYNTWLGIIALLLAAVIAGPSLWQLILQGYAGIARGQTSTALIILVLIAFVSWLSAISLPLVLFFVKKESTLRTYIVAACIIPGCIGIALGIGMQNYFILGISIASSLFALWQSSRVGLLSTLGRKRREATKRTTKSK